MDLDGRLSSKLAVAGAWPGSELQARVEDLPARLDQPSKRGLVPIRP